MTQNEQNILMFILLIPMKIITYELCKNNIKVSKEGILESHNLWQGLWKEIYKRTSEIDQQDYKCHSKREIITLCQNEIMCIL